MSSQPTQQPQRQWGVTPPISLAMPTDKEKELTSDLLQTLHDHDLFESEADAKKRYRSLKIQLVKRSYNNASQCLGPRKTQQDGQGIRLSSQQDERLP